MDATILNQGDGQEQSGPALVLRARQVQRFRILGHICDVYCTLFAGGSREHGSSLIQRDRVRSEGFDIVRLFAQFSHVVSGCISERWKMTERERICKGRVKFRL